MQKPVFLLCLLGLVGSAKAQTAAPSLHPDVPAAMDVAGIHLLLNEEARRMVQQKADALCRHQPSFQARVNLADGSFPLIDKILEQEGVPLDFRYLALQESALQGNAQSPHGAVGYWQLKRETATELGLLVNEAVDERQHLTASTRAAARYLVRSNATTHNWVNTMLSYYTGLGGVKPYILPTDAGATEMNITEQTAPYVLMFLAQKVAYEPSCGLNPKPPLRLTEFPAVAGQTLTEQAQTIYADPAALATHNHWLLAPTVPADKPYTLIVPVTDAAQAAGLVANQRLNVEQGLITAPGINTKNRAEVRVNNLRALIALPNETLSDLAKRGKQKLGSFLHHNEMRPFDAVVSGRPYYLESKRESAAVEYHVLQANETLADVAQRYGIRQKAITHKNHLRPHEELRPGRVLWLQHSRPRDVAVEYRTASEGVGLELPVGSPRPPAPAPVAVAPRPAPAPVIAPTEKAADEVTENLNELPAAPAPIVAAPTPVVVAPEPLVVAPAPVVGQPVPVEPRPIVPAAPPAKVPVPTPAPAAPVTRTEIPPSAPAPAAMVMAIPAGGLYTVQASESVYAIARRYGLRPADLLAWNQLPPNAGLRLGQVIRLNAPPTTPATATPVAPAPTPHPTNTAGTATNPAIYVPQPKNRPASPPTTPPVTTAKIPRQHIVAKGETCFSIARRYNLTAAQLMEYNGKQTETVKIGEVLKLSPK